MENAIKNTRSMIEKQVEQGKCFCSGAPFSKYQKVYFGTNENIKEYLSNINFNDKEKAISVLASGDHVFNLGEKGIKNIDTFDTNSLTEFYVFGLRYAMFMRYSYKEYLLSYSKIIDINTSLEELTSIMDDLLPFMDDKYRKYWRNIINYNYKLQKVNNTNLNLFSMLFMNIISSEQIIDRNNYLKDEESYNRFKTNLMKSNITFKNINALDLAKEFKGGYDVMLLSNIFEYLHNHFCVMTNYKDIEGYIKELLSIMNEEGKIFLAYIFDYATKTYVREKLFQMSNVTLNDFKNYDFLRVDSCRKEKVQDGVLILKK